MRILDMCCGGKMFWWDKENPVATFIDKRTFSGKACDGRTLKVQPDHVMDFTNIEFPDDTFDLVVFDPPHLVRAGEKSWLRQKYGVLPKDWKEELKQGFLEGQRVLKPNGTMIFKWNEYQVKLHEVLEVFDVDPLFGNRTSKNTIWVVFGKNNNLVTR